MAHQHEYINVITLRHAAYGGTVCKSHHDIKSQPRACVTPRPPALVGEVEECIHSLIATQIAT